MVYILYYYIYQIVLPVALRNSANCSDGFLLSMTAQLCMVRLSTPDVRFLLLMCQS